MATSSNDSRRNFLRTSVGAAAGLALPAIVPAHVLGQGAVAPSEKLTLGVIGIGPRGTYDLTAMLGQPDVQCVAIADVQASRRNAAKQLVDHHYGTSDCRTYRDLRELLARDDVDAVLVATGDRWHAPASMMAAEAGKDVYSEKPCGLTIELCQQLDETIRRTGRVFQAGTQRRNVHNFQQAVDLAHSGKLGKLQTLHATVYRPEINNTWLPGQSRPDEEVVDWNVWLGPAPWRPYNKQYVDGGWRGYWDFDSGAKLLDWGAHTIDLCQWANQSDDTMPVRYEPSKDSISAHYENGVRLAVEFLDTPFGERPGWIQHLGTCPVRFVGDEGWVEVGDSGGIEMEPVSLKRDLPQLPKKRSGLDVSAHSRDFFDSIKSRGTPKANSQVMRRSHIACHAAALSWILQRPLNLDPRTERFVDDDEANRLCSRPARNPWRV